MVSGLWCHLQAVALVLLEADERPKSMLERLDPATRGKAVMALFGLAVLGVGLILLVMMGWPPGPAAVARASSGKAGKGMVPEIARDR